MEEGAGGIGQARGGDGQASRTSIGAVLWLMPSRTRRPWAVVGLD